MAGRFGGFGRGASVFRLGHIGIGLSVEVSAQSPKISREIQGEINRSGAWADPLENVIRVHPTFISAWETVDFNEGMLPFKQLLDATLFPSGALVCYPPGTDVRVPS